jgi:hypothetical protein
MMRVQNSSPWMWAGISPLSWWAAGGCAVVPPLVASPEKQKKHCKTQVHYVHTSQYKTAANPG